MTLIEFYKNVLKSLGLVVENEYIYVKDTKGNKIPLVSEQKQMVLPTRKQLNSLLEEDEDGEVKVTKLPYNPLNEDVVKGDTESLKKTKLIVERQIGHGIAAVGELLLKLASNPALQKKTNMEINKFLTAISEAKNANIKQLVDDTSISKWIEIYTNSLKKTNGMVKIYLKKSGVSAGVKYNRLAVMDSEVYNEIKEATKDGEVYGVKLRNKDIIIFRIIFEYLLPEMNTESCVELGSNDNESPAFIALYRLYLQTYTRLNRVATLIKNVDLETADSVIKELPIEEDDLLSLNMFKQELCLIPNENDLTRSKINTSKIPGMDGSVFNQVSNTNKPHPTTAVDYNQPDPNEDPQQAALKKILGNATPVVPIRNVALQQQQYPQQMQQPMYQQQMMMQQPMMPQQQMYQQPMYQQPMFQQQQPMMQRPIQMGGYPQQQQPFYQQPQPMFQQQQPFNNGNGIFTGTAPGYNPSLSLASFRR